MTNPDDTRGTCLVGAGHIAGIHAEALRALGIPLTAVVDPNGAARQRLAERYKIGKSFASIEEALASGSFSRAHVLVPPDLHAATALPLVRAGKAVLIEKPIATDSAACQELVDAASSAPVGVNQNFVFHPAFVRLRDAVHQRRLGLPRFVNVIYHAQLRQLDSRQFGHWMFREPRNLLLEQAVHPISQIAVLLGEIQTIQAAGSQPIEIAPGVRLVPSFSATLSGTTVPASLRFAVGEEFPVWQVSVVCDDGILFADILANRFWSQTRTRWLEQVDDFVSGQRQGFALGFASWRNLLSYGLSTLGLVGRSDSFFQSMRVSIADFHAAVDHGTKPLLDAQFGAEVVSLCDRISTQIAPASVPRSPRPLPNETSQRDVAVLGGTGFIGTALVRRLSAAGMTVSVMARNTTNLPAEFNAEGVTLHRGDIRNPTDVARAIAGTKFVVNLAHGGGGASWEEIRDAMVGGAETVARACLSDGNKPLIYVGSIAALYLGPDAGTVTGSAMPDAQAESRADYARAKALCEVRLAEMRRQSGLAVTVLRPGLVVGQGTSPFHSGLGFFNNTQHCIGWNEGRNPLPFVLVEDVADAIVLSLDRPSEGKSYNLVGDFRPSARDYLAELARRLHRPLRFHGKSPYSLYASEVGKWCVKRIGGRKIPMPSLHDILSRGLKAQFDCGDAKSELGWQPVADPDAFYASAFGPTCAQ